MGMAQDLGYIDPMQRYIDLRRSGVPADVAASIINNPSYGEGEFRGSGWPNTYGGREYRSEGKAMPGMLGDDQSQMSPQDMARLRLMMQIMQNRGTSGMQQNPLMGGGQLFGQALLQNPQLLQWLMQQQNGGVGNYPQGGGAVDLAQQPFRYPVL